jgi:hypothetical protein
MSCDDVKVPSLQALSSLHGKVHCWLEPHWLHYHRKTKLAQALPLVCLLSLLSLLSVALNLSIETCFGDIVHTAIVEVDFVFNQQPILVTLI